MPRRSSLPALLLAGLLPAAAPAQGPLTPPGAPGPGMKSLTEIDAKLERRIPLSAAPATISTPGSYYLTGSFTVPSGTALIITADDVTLDLNGFTIGSSAASPGGFAILLNGALSNVTIRNGCIRSTTTVAGNVFTGRGFSVGITVGGACSNVRVSDLHIVGTASHAIAFPLPTVRATVERCQVRTCGANGIEATLVSHCRVEDAGAIGISAASVSHSHANTLSGLNFHPAILATDTVDHCRGEAAGGIGISAASVLNSSGSSDNNTGLAATQATNCTGSSGINNGLTATSAQNCTGSSNTGNGLFVTLASNCQGTSNSGVGLLCSQAAMHCSGTSTSGVGLIANGTATNCFGTSTSGSTGLQCLGAASFCRGKRDGGTAINAPITVACTVSGTGTITSASKQLGTP